MIKLDIYVKEDCGPCKVLKAFILRHRVKLQRKFDITFHDRSEGIEKGIRQFPTAYFDGKQVTTAKEIIAQLGG